MGGNLPPRDGHCTCSCGGKIFIFGGVVQTGVESQHNESNDLLMFDPGKTRQDYRISMVTKFAKLTEISVKVLSVLITLYYRPRKNHLSY